MSALTERDVRHPGTGVRRRNLPASSRSVSAFQELATSTMPLAASGRYSREARVVASTTNHNGPARITCLGERERGHRRAS